MFYGASTALAKIDNNDPKIIKVKQDVFVKHECP